MTAEAWTTLLVLAIAIFAMVRDLVPPAVAILGATIVLLLADVITTEEAFAGFSNPAPLTIAVLYILAAAAARTGLLQPLVASTLGRRRSVRGGLGRLLPPVGLASSVLNNTPIVAMLVPEVGNWATRHGRQPSRYLMPISFAAILGGTVTLIGTSTNLVVSGLLEAAGHEPLGFFEITPVGLPIAVIGVGLVVLLAPLLLPDRPSTRDELTERMREFTVDMTVDRGGPLDGATVEEAGLRDLAGVFLVEVGRGEETIVPVAPTTRLHGDDTLRFVGRAGDVVDLHAMRGLRSGAADHMRRFDLERSNFFEAVVGATSPLIGKTLKEAGFRGAYGGAVVAVHRAGQRVDAKLGEVPLRVGDTLVVLSDEAFRERWMDRGDFLLVSRLGSSPMVATGKRPVAAAILAAVVLLAATGTVSVLKAALLGALAVIALRVLRPGEARAAIDLDVVLLIAGGFGLAAAMEKSGLAETIATGLVDSFGTVGSAGGLLGIVLATVLLTETVSNTAAALIVFPIAASASEALGYDLRGVAIAVAVAASASFLTPVGYQTNVMVYGPGGYRYTDYARLGAPLTVLAVTGIMIIVPLLWPLGG
jgi:di/tricarboxylate transporter